MSKGNDFLDVLEKKLKDKGDDTTRKQSLPLKHDVVESSNSRLDSKFSKSKFQVSGDFVHVLSEEKERLHDLPSTSYLQTNAQEHQPKNTDGNPHTKSKQQPLPYEPPRSSAVQQPAGLGSEVFSLKKYKVRAGTIDLGHEYEWKLAALFSLRCLRPGVKDMWIASNAEGAGCFDDIILHMEQQNGQEITFMLQVKHGDNPRNIMKADFLVPKGNFSLSKYLKDIARFHESMYTISKKQGILRDLGECNNIYFILFTNRGTYNCEFLERHLDSYLSFLDTSTDPAVYRFNVTKLPDIILSNKIASNYNLFLFSNQVSAKYLDVVIMEEIRKISNTLQLGKLNMQDIARGFIMYTTEWAKGNLGGHYCLTKKDILYKLTELLLNQYTLNLIEKPFISYKKNTMHIWNDLIADQVITVVEYRETVLNFLIEFLSTEVQKYCDRPIINWAKQLPQEEQQIFRRTHYYLNEQILKQVGNYGRIRPVDIYKSLWKVNILPLLLKVSNLVDVKTVFSILKLSNYHYKVIILYENIILSHKHEEEQQYKEEIPNCFKTLQDLSKKERNKVLEQKVKLQGRSGARLGDIVTEEMFRYITSTDILCILSDDFNIGIEVEVPVEYIIERTIIMKGVKRAILEKCDQEIFLIRGNLTDSLTIQPRLREYTIFEVNNIDFSNSETIPGIINIHEDVTFQQIEKLKSSRKPIHILSVYDQDYFEWEWSHGSTKTIEHYKVTIECQLNEETIHRLLSTSRIISDIPGMGKSVLTSYLAYCTPVNKWVLKVNLNEHQSYFRQRHQTPTTDALTHLRYFYDITCKYDENSELSQLIFENLVSLKKIIILFDGFDEVAAAYRNEVTNLVRSLHEQGYQVLITTRPVMKQHLEETFRKTSISIKPFTREILREFLVNFFTSVHCDLNVPAETRIQMFVEKLIKMVSENLNDMECEFMSIPLQSRLLADVFSNECRQYISNTDSIDFDINYDFLYLYKMFIENKINIFVEKYGDVAYEQHEEIREHQALLAIKLVFPLEQIIEADTIKQVYQPLIAKPKLIQLLQREGIMIVDDKGNITCVHRTIAEFLAAQWLSDNLQNTNEEIKKFVHDLIMERFTRNYTFVFYIFDRILSQNCPLHLAIINKQINVALDSINSNSEIVNVSDKGGRSALHIVALNGLEYPIPYDRWYSEKDKMLAIAQKLICDTIIMKSDVLGYTPLDYALASRSLQIANELCINMADPFTNIYIDLQYQEDYLQYSTCTHLLPILLSYFASRDLLQNNVKKDTNPSTYYVMELYEYKTMIQILQSEYGRTYSGYVKKTFNSYYSDFRHAIVCGSTNNVNQLLQQEETEINKRDMDNNTALHYAVLHGRSEIVKLLLEKNANVNKQNKDLNTPLHLAVSNLKNTNIIEMLLSKKQNIHTANSKGETALHLVFSNRQNKTEDKNLDGRLLYIVNLLLSEGVDINLENNSGENPLHYSIKNWFPDSIINYLLNCGANVNKTSYDGYTPLLWAVKKGRYETAKFLVASGAHVNAQNVDTYTPLICAIQEGHEDIVKFLATNGADVNVQVADGYTPLLWATKQGHNETVKFLVANGANVNVHGPYRYTPLFWAAKQGHEEIMKFLIVKGADVNVHDADGYTPIVWIARMGFYETVKLLVASGADVNVQVADGYTSLLWAAKQGHDEIVKFLVANGANVNVHGAYGYTPLLWAAKQGRDESVKFLVANGANLNVQDADGYTPLVWAARQGCDKVVKYLVENGADVNIQNASDYTPLFWAVIQGRDEIVNFLVANGADINVQDADGYTPLLWAAKKGRHESVKCLVANSAHVNTQNVDGYSPLLWAARRGHNEIVKFLVANGADINVQDADGYTPLLWAARQGHDEIVKFLVANNSDVNVCDAYRYTPLFWAAKQGHDEITKFLVLKGADVNVHDSEGYTPIVWIARMGFYETVKLLVASGADVNVQVADGYTPLLWAAKQGHDETVKFLVENGANVNVHGAYGYTPLLWAAKQGRDESVKFLVENGANLNVQDADGYTPLVWAARQGSDKVVKFLVANGADVNIQNASDYTPLFWAVRQARDEIVNFLVANGADINVQDADGYTPLLWAARRGHDKIVKFLVANGAINKTNSNTKNSDGGRPLKSIDETAHEENVKFLGNEEKINMEDMYDHTLLFEATNNDNDEIVKFPVNEEELRVKNQLIEAVQEGCCETVKSLIIKKGADVEATDSDGYTPLIWAAEMGRYEIAKFLVENGANVNAKGMDGFTPLICAAEMGHQEIVQFLVANGADLNVKTAKGNTLLIWTAERGHEDVVKFLVKKGADANLKAVDGSTLLSWAIKNGNEEMVKFLVANGADADAKSANGNTLLIYAAERGHEEIVKILIKNGADVNVKAENGNTLLSWAVERNHEGIITFLNVNKANLDF